MKEIVEKILEKNLNVLTLYGLLVLQFCSLYNNLYKQSATFKKQYLMGFKRVHYNNINCTVYMRLQANDMSRELCLADILKW